jgi:hypothetical protein
LNDSLINVDDLRDYDAFLKRRGATFRQKLADWLQPHRLTLAEARVHRVLIPALSRWT